MSHLAQFRNGGVILGVLCGVAAPAQAQPSGFEGYQVVRVEIGDEGDLQVLAGLLTLHPQFELWSEALGIGPIDVRIAPEARPLLDASGLCYEVVIEDLQWQIDEEYGLHDLTRDDDFFDHLRTYDEHVQFMQDLVATYPDLAEMISLGDSVEGRPLWALRITGPDGPADKPGVLYHGAQHGNEQVGASVVAYTARHLFTNYDADPNVAALVDNVEWFLLPIMNPDGYVRYGRYNANWIDLNRNWGGPGSGHDYTGGPYPFSEPETAALRDFFAAHANVRVHVDLHGYTNYVLWPWGHSPGKCPDHWTFESRGSRIHDLIVDAGGGSYRLGSCYSALYPVSGGSTSYSYAVERNWAFTFELANDVTPAICQQFLPTLLYLSGWISDCDGDGITNAEEIASGSSDCNSNGVPDECEADCNGNGIADSCEIENGSRADCNGNRIPDECEIADGTSYDCDGDGVLDQCTWDCNGNGIADVCDIADGVSEDCSGNGIPDECEPDCNGNGVADSCDIAAGSAEDCDGNGVLDECELTGVRIDLERSLVALDSNHGEIAALVPDRFDFSEGSTGYVIRDGGEHMYESGNRLATDLSVPIPYTGGLIRPGEAFFGPNSRYLTAKYDGLFLAIVSDMSISAFSLRGALGITDSGNVELTTLLTTVNNTQFAVFVKRAFDGGTPSVNHLVIFRGNGEGIGHDSNLVYPARDWDQLTGLSDFRNLAYVLVARQDGLYLDDADVLNIANAVLHQIVFEDRDCNGNGRPDACDIADGASQDFNNNGIPDECECIGDLNTDGHVGLTDLAQLLGHYGTTSGAAYTDGDLDLDGDVDLTDLTELLGAFGNVCIDCLGDLDGDQQVNLDDLAQLVGHYGTNVGASYTDGDLDFDGDVDLHDLAELLGVYGTICE